jgi:hypothetical protein
VFNIKPAGALAPPVIAKAAVETTSSSLDVNWPLIVASSASTLATTILTLVGY